MELRLGEREIKVLAIVMVLATLPNFVHPQILYSAENELVSSPAVQLWYNGYWKHPGWVNGTLVGEKATNFQDNIVAVTNKLAPYENQIRKYVRLGVKAVVILRDRRGTPGQGMYLIDGSDQSDLTVPVIEVYEDFSNEISLNKLITDSGVQVSIWPQTNAWKVANETVFQAILNVLLSLMEITILLLATWRLIGWYRSPHMSLLSIGPICIMLEMVATSLRLSFSCVDPFWTYRMMPDLCAQILVSAHMPFMFASGILLTFFWAETLNKTRIKVSPFISEYKKSAFCVIAILFTAEIVCTIIRILVPVQGSFNPGYIVQIFYVLCAIILTLCYVWCAVSLSKRLKTTTKRKTYVRQMTLRFSISTGGYIIVIIATILSVPFISQPWGWKICFNFVYFGSNLTALLQVYSFMPPKRITNSARDQSSGHSASYTDSRPGTTSTYASPRSPANNLSSATDPTSSSEASESSSLQSSEAQMLPV